MSLQTLIAVAFLLVLVAVVSHGMQVYAGLPKRLSCPMIFGRGFDTRTRRISVCVITRKPCIGAMAKSSFSDVSFPASKNIKVSDETISVQKQLPGLDSSLIITRKLGRELSMHRNEIIGCYNDSIVLNALGIRWGQRKLGKARCCTESYPCFYYSRRSPAYISDLTFVENIRSCAVEKHFRLKAYHPCAFSSAGGFDLTDDSYSGDDGEKSNHGRRESVQPIKPFVRIIGCTVFLSLTLYFCWLAVECVLSYDGIRGWIGFWGFAILALLGILGFFQMLSGTCWWRCLHNHQEHSESKQPTERTAHKCLVETEPLGYPTTYHWTFIGDDHPCPLPGTAELRPP